MIHPLTDLFQSHHWRHKMISLNQPLRAWYTAEKWPLEQSTSLWLTDLPRGRSGTSRLFMARCSSWWDGKRVASQTADRMRANAVKVSGVITLPSFTKAAFEEPSFVCNYKKMPQQVIIKAVSCCFFKWSSSRFLCHYEASVRQTRNKGNSSNTPPGLGAIHQHASWTVCECMCVFPSDWGGGVCLRSD